MEVLSKTPFDSLTAVLEDLVNLYRNLFDHLQNEKIYLIAANFGKTRRKQ